MVSQQHIPAWKKLGLKLKYAKDISVDTNENVDNVSSQKRKFPIEEEDSIRIASIPSKKIKTPKKSHAVPKSPTANGSILPSAAQEDRPIQRISTPSPSPAKRKSVSFTPETKVEDGDSIKQLYAAWLAGQKQEDPSFRAEAANKALKSITPASASDAKDLSKVKKAKKPKPRSLSSSFPSSQAPTSTYTPPLLIYLSDYHTSPTSWKFNKAKQSHLLKSVFDTTLIPSSYDTALKAYLTGLNGSAARSRLRAAALEIRKQDAKEEQEEEKEKEEASPKTEDNTTPSTSDQKKGDEMENPALRRQNYKQALRWYKAQLEDEEFEREERERELDPAWQLKLAKRKRAELILCAIGETEPDALDGGAVPGTERATGAENGDVAGGQKKMRLGDGTVVLVVKKKRKRKRKVRTGVPDDDSSSSSESSSSSSSSSSSDSDSSVEADESEASTSDESDDDGDDTSSSSSSSSASASQETESTGSSKESGDASGSPSSGGSGNESESSSGESSRSDNEEGVEEEEE